MAITLEEVHHAFESWRASRVKRGPIPDHLWSMVEALLPHYKKSKISKALNINTTQLVLGCKKYREHHHAKSGFAVGWFKHEHCSDDVIPNEAWGHAHNQENLLQQKRCELTIRGASKNLHISIDITQLAQVFPVMVGYL